jgi:hypothetical protein
VMLNYLNWKKVNLIPDSRYGDIRTPSQWSCCFANNISFYWQKLILVSTT